MTIETDAIVARLISECGYPEKDAGKVVQDLQACAPVVQAAFEQWWQGEGLDEQLVVQGYTLQQFIDTHGFNPVGAFLTMDWLIREPELALQALSQGHDYVLVSPEVRTAYEQAKERGRYGALMKRIRAFFGSSLHPLISASLDDFALPEETKLFLQSFGLPVEVGERLLIHFYATAEILEMYTQDQERYLIIGDDYGTKLAIQEHTGEIWSLDVLHGTLPARFVNATILTFLEQP